MHPELLRALAKARHDDLLHAGVEAEGSRAADTMTMPGVFLAHGKRMGAVLIWAGTRLVGDGGAALELSHD